VQLDWFCMKGVFLGSLAVACFALNTRPEILPELKARRKTVLVISHDDHYYHVADRIIKFEDGQIVEDRLNIAAEAAGDALRRIASGGIA
jgi:ABC-type bacteriocin/lantibiotic exporter with double-glycine peptidase domain